MCNPSSDIVEQQYRHALHFHQLDYDLVKHIIGLMLAMARLARCCWYSFTCADSGDSICLLCDDLSRLPLTGMHNSRWLAYSCVHTCASTSRIYQAGSAELSIHRLNEQTGTLTATCESGIKFTATVAYTQSEQFSCTVSCAV